MPESVIRKLMPFADMAKENGKKVYHLNIGQPDIKTSQAALDAVKNFNLKILKYSPSEGFRSYREGLVDYYKKADIEVEIDNLLVSTGGSEAILFTLNSITDPGDEIIIPEPFYANYSGFGISIGVNIIPVTSHLEKNFALPPIEEFEKLITPSTKAIIICNPGNPTGYIYTLEELQKLRELALKYDLFLIADEVYREFVYDDAKHFSILNLKELEKNAIVIDSVSKRYSMCGARIGCVISRNEEFMATVLKYAQARLSPPTLAQIASEAALQTEPKYFSKIKQEYLRRRNTLVEDLNEIEGVCCPRPRGAFYAVAELMVDSAQHFAQWLLSDFDLDNETVMVTPAEGFYVTPGMGLNQVRLAYVLEQKALKRSVEILKTAMRAYPGSLI